MFKGKFLVLGLEFCVFLCALKGIFYHQMEIKKEKQLRVFFQEKKEYGFTGAVQDEKGEKYLGVIVIPKIDLKAGFYDKDSKYNSVEYGIQCIANSKMPNENGNLILASHSGSSAISYFKNIHFLKKNDFIYIYYKGVRYIYTVQFIYEEEKNGSITLPLVQNQSILTLTTCQQDKQLILICEQMNTSI